MPKYSNSLYDASTSVQREHFVGIKSEYGDAAIIQAVATGHFNCRDEGLIREFIAARRESAGISIGRANKITFTLISWRRFLPHFAVLTIPDIYTGIEVMRAGKNLKGRSFKQNTQHDYIRILKQFLLWKVENEYIDLPEKKVKKIRTPPDDTMTKKAGDLLTPKEIQSLVNVCNTSRDRALILALYEGGFRVGEISKSIPRVSR
jgi:site-specific recombinase XerD